MNILTWGVALLCLYSLKTTIIEVTANPHHHCDFSSSSSCDEFLISGGRSLTKDVLFFLIFLSQAFVLLVFFWQRRQFITRTLASNLAPTSDPLTSPSKAKSPPNSEQNNTVDDMNRKQAVSSQQNRSKASSTSLESELDKQLQPIEKTIDELNAKIKRLENTLFERKNQYPTESLKLRLRECISQISNVLSELEKVGHPLSPLKTDANELKKLEEQRNELEKKRKVLEERLMLNKG